MAEAQAIIQDFRSQAKSFFDRLPVRQKWLLFGILTVVILGFLAVVYFAQQPTYSNLVTGISPKEAAQVAARLDEAQITYQIAPGGGGILVPSEMADKAKLAIANSDVLNGGVVGLEIFDKSNYTATEFQQNVQLQRALEGELSRLITKINLIESAKVILAIPKKSVFLEQDEKTTAAVHVQIKDSSPLDPSRVKTILNLVASGVPGLKVEGVKISDQYGNLYTSDMSSLKLGGEGNSLAMKHNVEKYLENKVTDELSKIASKDGVTVKVSADINTESIRTEEKLVDPDLQAVVSEQTNNEKNTGSRSVPIGVPGISSNSPEIRTGSGEVANVQENNKNSRVVNYENSIRHIIRENSPGDIKRLSVAVLIDDKAVVNKTAGGLVSIGHEKWSQDELAQITSIAQNAVGFNAERGDKIDVKNISFSTKVDETAQITEISSQALRDTWSNVVKYGLAGFLSLLVLVFVVRPMVKRFLEKPEDYNLILGLPSTVRDLEGERDDDAGLELRQRANEPAIPQRGQILELAKQDAVLTAGLVRNWLKEP